MHKISEGFSAHFGPHSKDYLIIYNTRPDSNFFNPTLTEQENKDLIFIRFCEFNPDSDSGFNALSFSDHNEYIILVENDNWQIGKLFNNRFKPRTEEFSFWLAQVVKSHYHKRINNITS